MNIPSVNELMMALILDDARQGRAAEVSEDELEWYRSNAEAIRELLEGRTNE